VPFPRQIYTDVDAGRILTLPAEKNETPMQVTEGPFDWPLADEAVADALQAAYRDGSWGQYHGRHGQGLCEDLQAQFGTDHALLCSSGTIGVELALRGCGVSAGDEVVFAGYDFPGNFRAVEAVGARPVLVDVSLDTWCLSADTLVDVDRPAAKAVIVSHLHGGLADMARIVELARLKGWAVVEDAWQQPGATIAGRAVGSWGDVGVLSFGGSKLLTAGRGGAVLTSDEQIHQRMKIFAERGNWAFPLSELQAAVLRPQLAKLAELNLVRREHVNLLLQQTAELSEWLRPVSWPQDAQPAFYKLAWSFIPAEELPELREELIGLMKLDKAPIDAGFRGFTRRSSRRCTRLGELDNSQRLSRSTLLLHHPILLGRKKAAQQVAQVLNHRVHQLGT